MSESSKSDRALVVYYDLVRRWERASGLVQRKDPNDPGPEAAAFHWRGIENRMIVAEEKIRRLAEWTHQYDERLCADCGCSNTFIDGVMVAKEQVASILRIKKPEGVS